MIAQALVGAGVQFKHVGFSHIDLDIDKHISVEMSSEVLRLRRYFDYRDRPEIFERIQESAERPTFPAHFWIDIPTEAQS